VRVDDVAGDTFVSPDLPQHVGQLPRAALIVQGEERVRDASLPRAPRAPDAVHVVFRAVPPQVDIESKFEMQFIVI